MRVLGSSLSDIPLRHQASPRPGLSSQIGFLEVTGVRVQMHCEATGGDEDCSGLRFFKSLGRTTAPECGDVQDFVFLSPLPNKPEIEKEEKDGSEILELQGSPLA